MRQIRKWGGKERGKGRDGAGVRGKSAMCGGKCDISQRQVTNSDSNDG